LPDYGEAGDRFRVTCHCIVFKLFVFKMLLPNGIPGVSFVICAKAHFYPAFNPLIEIQDRVTDLTSGII
jgi:hypothetical protein